MTHKSKDNYRHSSQGARSLSPIQSSRPEESYTGRISHQNSWLGRPVGFYIRICGMLDHKTHLSEFKKTETISSILSNNNIGLEINYKGKKFVENHKHTEAK